MSAVVVPEIFIASGLVVVFLLNSRFQAAGQLEHRYPVAQTLPHDLLILIFELVSQHDPPGVRNSLLPPTRACQAWNNVSTPLLYKIILLKAFSTTRGLTNTLRANPQLGRFVQVLIICSPPNSLIRDLISYFLPNTGPSHLDAALGDLLPLCAGLPTVFLVADILRAAEGTPEHLRLGAGVFRSAGVHLQRLHIQHCDVSTHSVFSTGDDQEFPFPQLRSLELCSVYLSGSQRFPLIPYLERLEIVSPTFRVAPSTTSGFVLYISQRSFPALRRLKLSLSDITRQPVVDLDKPLVNGLKSLDLDATISRRIICSWLDSGSASNIRYLSLGRKCGNSRDISLRSLPTSIRHLKLAVERNASVLTVLTKFLWFLPLALQNCNSIERLTLESVAIDYFHRESGGERVVDSNSFKSLYDNVIEEIGECCRSQGVSFVHAEKREVSFKGCIRD